MNLTLYRRLHATNTRCSVEDLLKPENKANLIATLTYHILPGKVMSKDIAGKKLAAKT